MDQKNPNESDPVPALEDLALRVMPMPADLNPLGDVFGGWIMAMVDIAGAVPARRRVRGRVVTVAVNSFSFRRPVAVGDLVSFYARVVRVGRSSITVDVVVFSEPQDSDGSHQLQEKVTEATLTYVAIDDEGKKRLIAGSDGAGSELP